MFTGRWGVAVRAAIPLFILILAATRAEASIAPELGKTHTIQPVGPQLPQPLSQQQWFAMKFASPAIDHTFARFVSLKSTGHAVKSLALETPDRRLPSVRELAGAPAHAPVRLNSTPDPRLQPLASLMPETNPYLLSANRLDRQTGCLALAIYYEARSEDQLGQIAVAQVILNRVKSRKYPGTICRVVFQNAHDIDRCQFSFACDGRMENPRHLKAWQTAVNLARKLNCRRGCTSHPRQLHPLMRLTSQLQRATHYHADYVSPYWSRLLIRSGRVGRHIFYISKRVWS